MPLLAKLVITDHSSNRDKKVVCYRCDAGSSYAGCEEYDQRFTRLICAELDKIERDNWYQTIKPKRQRILNVKQLSRNFAMLGRRDRTPLEEIEAIRRHHEEVCNADPEQLREMAEAYLGDDYMEEGP